MLNKKLQKLELTWIGKGEEPKPEPRILIENPEYSYGDPDTENMLIHGDNLLALKALEQDFTGKIKCIYIDPPYNTGNAFEHYDDDESQYLKILCDEIFGRQNFIANVIWEKKYSPQNDAKWLSDSHDHILVYAKGKEKWRPFLLPRTTEMNNRYKNPDNDNRGVWKSSDFSVKTYSAANDYPITLPSGRIVNPPQSRCWVTSKKRYEELVRDNRIWFGESGNNVPSVKKFLTEVKEGTVSKTIWFRSEVGDNQEAKKETKNIVPNNPFGTPKPERLIERIVRLASESGDIILDSFLGSGTTAAVAQKMNRKWIGVELGEHAITHCVPRLKKVTDGEQGGISKAVNWKGGGGFKFYTLAPSLLNEDKYGNWIIAKEYNAPMLAAAMAKQEGFRYQPHESMYWKQGRSSEQDFIFTTTQFITVENLDNIHEEMQPGESLLICCKAFQRGCKSKYPNITIKKIPQMLLGKCEFGKEDYSLHIVDMPVEGEENTEATHVDTEPLTVKNKKETKRSKGQPNKDQPTLF